MRHNVQRCVCLVRSVLACSSRLPRNVILQQTAIRQTEEEETVPSACPRAPSPVRENRAFLLNRL